MPFQTFMNRMMFNVPWMHWWYLCILLLALAYWYWLLFFWAQCYLLFVRTKLSSWAMPIIFMEPIGFQLNYERKSAASISNCINIYEKSYLSGIVSLFVLFQATQLSIAQCTESKLNTLFNNNWCFSISKDSTSSLYRAVGATVIAVAVFCFKKLNRSSSKNSLEWIFLAQFESYYVYSMHLYMFDVYALIICGIGFYGIEAMFRFFPS